ncbi:KH domain-containing protein [Spathaspora sp. JA1]|nr:KH domain-containing protein [Spathaspora sp. JA1]
MSTSVILNLEYTFILDPKVSNPSTVTYYETNNGLWKRYTSDAISYLMIDNLNILHQISDQINLLQQKLNRTDNYITVIDPSVNNQLISVCCHGDEDFVTVSRQKILQTYKRINEKTLYITDQEFLSINKLFTQGLEQLCDLYQVEIIINNAVTRTPPENNPGYVIHILGDEYSITKCTTLVQILIDRLVLGLIVDTIPVDLSIIPIIGGIDLVNFNQVSQQTNAKIYIPCLNTETDTDNLQIYITAKHTSEIILTKFILSKLLASNSQLLAQDISICKTKIDILLLHHRQTIVNIMLKYGVFIQLPSLGEDDNYTITIQGSSVDSITECINDINSITQSYYYVEATTIEMSELALVRMSQNKTTCIISTNEHGIGIFGTNKEIVAIMQQLSGINYTKVKLRTELSNQHRDFISGKKNGKLIKIINQLNQLPVIKFANYNEYCFFIDVEIFEGSNISVLIKALELIELELPEELKFNIPQVFHKSIIGNGGSIIQSIMKKYNVFIKFSFQGGSDNLNNCYSLQRGSNVLIKCPRKNSKNIALVKIEIDNLVEQCCMNNQPNRATIYQTFTVQLLKQHYILLINNNKLQQLIQIENENNCHVNFPTSISQFQTNQKMLIDIRGSESKIRHCYTQFKDLLPDNFEFKLTFNQELFEQTFIVNKQEFQEKVIIPFKILLGFEISINHTHISNSQQYHQIILSYYNTSSLETAISSLSLYLEQKGFLIQDGAQANIDSLVENVGEQYSPLQSNMILRPITNSYTINKSPTRREKRAPTTNDAAKHTADKDAVHKDAASEESQ